MYVYSCLNFNQSLNNWNVSNVKSMEQMFKGCGKFNQSLNKWNILNITNMQNMFYGCNKLDDSNVLNIKKQANTLINTDID